MKGANVGFARARRYGTMCSAGRHELQAPVAAHAGVTQLVEFLPSKQAVAGSSPVSRSRTRNPSPAPCSLRAYIMAARHQPSPVCERLMSPPWARYSSAVQATRRDSSHECWHSPVAPRYVVRGLPCGCPATLFAKNEVLVSREGHWYALLCTGPFHIR